ncbi:hypothetical protein [Sorangium sp. So ce1182]
MVSFEMIYGAVVLGLFLMALAGQPLVACSAPRRTAGISFRVAATGSF